MTHPYCQSCDCTHISECRFAQPRPRVLAPWIVWSLVGWLIVGVVVVAVVLW